MSANQECRSEPPWQGRDARKYLRKRSLLPATLVTERGSAGCRVLDFSAGGAKLECAEAPAEGTSLTVMIEAVGTFSGKVIWRREHCVGVKFDGGIEKSAETSGVMVPTPAPLRDPPASAPAAEDVLGSLDEPGFSAPSYAAAAISTLSDSAEIVAVVTKPARAVEEPSTTDTTASIARAKRVLKLKPNREDVFTLFAGQPLFREGDPGGRMYVVQTGTLRIEGGASGEMEEIGSGAIVGEIELLEKGLRRRTTVIALTKCELIEINARRFRSLIGDRPDFALAVMYALSGRLRHMGDHRAADGTRDVTSRSGFP
jgi:hypothetical protein